MKVECITDKLKWAIATADKITGKNLSLPALKNVWLGAAGKSVTVRATNLDLALEITLPAKVDEPGTVMLNGAVVANFLSNLSRSEKIKLATVNNNLTIATAATSSVIKSYPPDDFPLWSALEETASFSISAPALLAGFRATGYAASLSDIKPEIASIYLFEADGDIICAATDSFRLAEKRIAMPGKIESGFRLILPIKNAAEVGRVFEGVNDELTIKYDKHQVAFVSPGLYLTSRLVEGIYPDYRQIIPRTATTTAVVLKSDLVNCLKLSNVFSDKLNQVMMKIAAKDKLLEITSRNSDIGETTTRLDAALEGDDLEISFNIKYLLDCLPVINADSVSLKFNGRTKPIVVSGIGDNSFTYLIMPLNR